MSSSSSCAKMSKVGNSLDYKMEKVLAKINLPVRQPNDQVYHPLTKFMVPDAQLEAVNPEFETGLTLTHSVAGLHKLRPVAYPILPQRHAKPLPQSINLTDDQYITLGVIMSKCLTDGYPISKIMALNWLELSDWKIVPTLKHVKDFVDTHRPKLHMKLWDIYAENTLGWVSAKRLYEDDVHHVTSLCRIGSIDLAIGLIAICSGSACIAVEFYRPAVTMMMHYYVDILEFDIFTPHTLEIEIARFAEVVWKAYLPDLSMD